MKFTLHIRLHYVRTPPKTFDRVCLANVRKDVNERRRYNYDNYSTLINTFHLKCFLFLPNCNNNRIHVWNSVLIFNCINDDKFVPRLSVQAQSAWRCTFRVLAAYFQKTVGDSGSRTRMDPLSPRGLLSPPPGVEDGLYSAVGFLELTPSHVVVPFARVESVRFCRGYNSNTS